MDWAQVLVIILAVLFAVFMIVAIALAVLLLKITRQIKSAAASAERTVHALEGSMSTFNKTALPLMIARGIINRVIKGSRKQERSSRDG